MSGVARNATRTRAKEVGSLRASPLIRDAASGPRTCVVRSLIDNAYSSSSLDSFGSVVSSNLLGVTTTGFNPTEPRPIPGFQSLPVVAVAALVLVSIPLLLVMGSESWKAAGASVRDGSRTGIGRLLRSGTGSDGRNGRGGLLRLTDRVPIVFLTPCLNNMSLTDTASSTNRFLRLVVLLDRKKRNAVSRPTASSGIESKSMKAFASLPRATTPRAELIITANLSAPSFPSPVP
mmetsp:Transcript_28013/g.38889  ORF Transcript_28013/g.38889 Transcript_28013/m.38889 type:complete len:234 (-) Transcript_28013:1824-2525(-)